MTRQPALDILVQHVVHSRHDHERLEDGVYLAFPKTVEEIPNDD